MEVLAIDPGPEQSAYVRYDGRVLEHAKCDNQCLVAMLRGMASPPVIACEWLASYGKPVGEEVFATARWIGRFQEAFGCDEHFHFYKRAEIKLHLCHATVGVNDGVIRQALIDRFGPGKEKAIGKKASPGPLFGLAGDEWAALALAVTYIDLHPKARKIRTSKGILLGKDAATCDATSPPPRNGRSSPALSPETPPAVIS